MGIDSYLVDKYFQVIVSLTYHPDSNKTDISVSQKLWHNINHYIGDYIGKVIYIRFLLSQLGIISLEGNYSVTPPSTY